MTYQDSCHLAHAQGVKQQPRAILQAIPGLQFVEMAYPAITVAAAAASTTSPSPRSSGRLLKEKMEDVAETKASIVAAANTGCMMQLEAGLRRFGPKKRQMAHVVELLDEAYRALDSE